MVFLENPRCCAFALRTRRYMQGIPFIEVYYCQFSTWGYRKATRICGVPRILLLKFQMCPGVKCPNQIVMPDGKLRRKEQLGGNHIRFSTSEKGLFLKG